MLCSNALPNFGTRSCLLNVCGTPIFISNPPTISRANSVVGSSSGLSRLDRIASLAVTSIAMNEIRSIRVAGSDFDFGSIDTGSMKVF